MAVWLALGLCRNVSIAGFGACANARGASASAGASAGASTSSVSRAPVYYLGDDNSRDLSRINAFDFHDMPAEWAWLRGLERRRVIRVLDCSTGPFARH